MRKKREVVYTSFGVALVELTQGKFAVIDETDAEWTGQWNWHFKRQGGGYAGRRQVVDGKPTIVYLHRAIAQLAGLQVCNLEIDHRSGDSLDNRRCNLRTATRLDNCANLSMNSNNTSGFKGVYWYARKHRWIASIRRDGHMKHIGSFETAYEAHLAYESAASQMFGDFKRPTELYK